MMMLLATRKAVMGELAISRRLSVLGWLCTTVMAGGGDRDVRHDGKIIG
jgi:Mn2+/Fe2+ NRAMP family transporter